MRNIFFIISFLIIITSCKSSSDLFIDKYIADQAQITDQAYSHDVFAQRDLATIYANKQKAKVALFFPFTGKHRDLAWDLYNSAMMSLFDNDANHNIELVLVDSKDNSVEASQVFREIVDRNIKLVVGPIFSNFTRAIDKQAMRHYIKAISLSNDQNLMENIDEDGGVFVGGFLPEQEIDRMVSYAMDQNKKNFAILAPNNSYGMAMARMLKDVVARRDGRVIQSELYDNSKEAIAGSVKRIIKAFHVDPALAEGGGNALEEDFRIAESDKQYADVIFVPTAGRGLVKVAKAIKKANKEERDIQIAAIGGWEDESLLNDIALNGTWFAAPLPSRYARFERNYYRYFGKYPPRIASIVYDSIAAIAQIVDKNESLDPQVEHFVNFADDEVGFEGIDGKFRFLENGLVQRNLAVLRLNYGRLKVVDEPTEIFLKYEVEEEA